MPVILGQADGVVEALGLGVVDDGFSDVLGLLVVTGQMEASLWVVGFEGDLQSVLDISNHAEKSYNGAIVLSLSIEAKGLLQNTLSLKILGPPLE